MDTPRKHPKSKRPEVAPTSQHANNKGDSALNVIAKLYVALHREGWEKGATLAEATEAAHDYYYNRFGYEGQSASTFLRKMGGMEDDKNHD